MDFLLPQNLFDLTRYQHRSIFEGCLYVWQALNNIHSYLINLKLGHIEVEIPKGAFLIHPELISIGKGCVVEQGAYIRGPCVIGENCQIRQGAYIRGDVIVGDNCVIGHDTEIKNSILLNNANAAHFAYLGDTVLGNYVNLGAGTKCANLRLDHQEIVVRFSDQEIRTGLKKIGAILGDGTQLGCNTVTNPGTITGKNVRCVPCLNFGGYIPENSALKSSVRIVIEPL